MADSTTVHHTHGLSKSTGWLVGVLIAVIVIILLWPTICARFNFTIGINAPCGSNCIVQKEEPKVQKVYYKAPAPAPTPAPEPEHDCSWIGCNEPRPIVIPVVQRQPVIILPRPIVREVIRDRPVYIETVRREVIHEEVVHQNVQQGWTPTYVNVNVTQTQTVVTPPTPVVIPPTQQGPGTSTNPAYAGSQNGPGTSTNGAYTGSQNGPGTTTNGGNQGNDSGGWSGGGINY